MNNSEITIRLAKIGDRAEVQKLFVETIETICKKDYNQEQIKVWTSSVENTQRWLEIFALQYVLVAELGDKIVGFISLNNTDNIDLLYVHKDHQRQGIADKLYHEIEKEAIRNQVSVLHASVSKTARPFFEKKSFIVLKEQTNLLQGVEIVNYKMTKQLVFH